MDAIHGVVPIIANDKFLVSDRFYQGVEAAFKYGCLTCHDYLDLDNAFICPKCISPGAHPEHPSPPADVEMPAINNKRILPHEDLTSTPAKRSNDDLTINGDGN